MSLEVITLVSAKIPGPSAFKDFECAADAIAFAQLIGEENPLLVPGKRAPKPHELYC